MTDPLRPFADAIRSLWRTRSAERGERSAALNDQARATTARAGVHAGIGESLRTRLKSRIAGLDRENPRKLRETFIETVLLWELGDPLANDPAFAEMVTAVSEQLASDPAVSARLHQLLLRLFEAPPNENR